MRWLGDPRVIRRANGILTLIWLAWFVPAVAIGSLRNSILAVAIYSVYANVVSHYTAWVAARADVHAGDAADRLGAEAP